MEQPPSFQVSPQRSLDPPPGADYLTSDGAAHNFLDFTVFVKNARLSSDERLLQLVHELEFIHWDLILFSETRTPSNDYQIEGGHRLILNFAHGGCSGTAILVHKRHADNIKAIHKLDDRLLVIDIRIGTRTFRVVAVYMPHASYAFEDLHSVYGRFHAVIGEAARRGRHTR